MVGTDQSLHAHEECEYLMFPCVMTVAKLNKLTLLYIIIRKKAFLFNNSVCSVNSSGWSKDNYHANFDK